MAGGQGRGYNGDVLGAAAGVIDKNMLLCTPKGFALIAFITQQSSTPSSALRSTPSTRTCGCCVLPLRAPLPMHDATPFCPAAPPTWPISWRSRTSQARRSNCFAWSVRASCSCQSRSQGGASAPPLRMLCRRPRHGSVRVCLLLRCPRQAVHLIGGCIMDYTHITCFPAACCLLLRNPAADQNPENRPPGAPTAGPAPAKYDEQQSKRWALPQCAIPLREVWLLEWPLYKGGATVLKAQQ